MAQPRKKLEWKKEVPFGLTASQFGMALGLSGHIVHFVDYVRNIVGTELEFTGNAITDHGINTEPKSRALYELLTSTAVSDGGFYLLEGRLLGCSPDGRVFEDAPPVSSQLMSPSRKGNETKLMGVKNGKHQENPISIRIPFRSKSVRDDSLATTPSPDSPTASTSKRLARLLEIKSPYYALYDSTKRLCHPFGIPQQYLCQMQGQMAIADVDVCDFFVYLDKPVCQVVAWRVYRSDEFWRWAHPKLLQVVEWIRDGPPKSLTKDFKFGEFDYSRINVEPLIFPYDISNSKPICDNRRFPFFAKFVNPYMDPRRSREQEEILRMLSSPVTRFLFDNNHGLIKSEGVEYGEEAMMWCCATADSTGSISRCRNSLASRWCGGAPNGAAAGGGEALALLKPVDFSDYRVTCRVYTPGEPACCDSSQGCGICLRRLRFCERKLFSRLNPLASPPDIRQLTTPLCSQPEGAVLSVSQSDPIESDNDPIIVVEDGGTSSCSSVEVIS
ncbi:YqaJ-like viral recombinase domain containing protein, putative [Trypanosoma equiperdum]|uniref:YqaJ viral recombinase domain-containing protein n=2 Tax=Trypanozoon TaxID=39700 RepID=Q381W1_TRYB2|nr:hypothetical protein, conserved [Trypanosoma brucei brucei TREU927]EAN80420.1 hypothetical protein, conserved [Trypanosoma brucei brucei TREU927]SCU67793.1 YqaJ-like viral recombinase domain containing protein, putative [Trypanosoma equiperdum]